MHGLRGAPPAVAASRPDATVHAVEADPAALTWARANIAAHVDAGTPVALHAADVGRPDLLPELESRVDLVLCNPPYVPDGTPVPPEVAGWDPPGAVSGGPDGLEIIRAVVGASAALLRYKGRLAIEHDDTHGDAAPALLRRRRVLTEVEEHRDLNGAPRFATARRAGPAGSAAPLPDERQRRLDTAPTTVPLVAPIPAPPRPGPRPRARDHARLRDLRLRRSRRAPRPAWAPRRRPRAPGGPRCCPPTPSDGLGADAFSSAAVRSPLAAKGRGPDMPVPVLVGSWSTIDGLVTTVPAVARELVEAFWPGGRSLVLPHAPSLTRTSASPVGHGDAEDAAAPGRPGAAARRRADGRVERERLRQPARHHRRRGHVPARRHAGGLPRRRAWAARGAASMIVDLTGDEPRILRAGAVGVEEINAVLGREVADRVRAVPARVDRRGVQGFPAAEAEDVAQLLDRGVEILLAAAPGRCACGRTPRSSPARTGPSRPRRTGRPSDPSGSACSPKCLRAARVQVWSPCPRCRC